MRPTTIAAWVVLGVLAIVAGVLGFLCAGFVAMLGGRS